jgi:ABC-2 type transport system ATP-binding protein
MIEIRGLTKTFDGFRALDGIDMTVKDGSIYGLVGTNGSGKTTILKLLNGITRPDSGTITVDGEPVYEHADVKARMSFIPDDLFYYYRQNLMEVGSYFRELYPVWDEELFHSVIRGFELNPVQKLARFSKGMQKQAVFALSLASLPDCLILDEPIDGLDPIVRKTIWSYIVDAAADRGMTTLVSSHNLREMEGFCDSIGIIDHGHMVLERDLDELKSDVHKLQVSFGSPDERPAGVYDGLNILHERTSGSVDFLIARNSAAELDRFRDEQQPLIFDRVPLSLEEIFIYELGGENDAIDRIVQ